MTSNSDRADLTLSELADLYIANLRMDAVHSSGRRGTVSASTSHPNQLAAVGDLWKTRGRANDASVLVLLTWVGGDINRGVLVFDEPELATSDDYLISAEHSPIGVPLAVCMWRDIPVSASSLDVRVGDVASGIMEPLAMLLQDRLTGGFIRRPFGAGSLSTADCGVFWSIEPEDGNGPELSYVTGSPVLRHSDPRLKVRTELISRSAYLEAAALSDLVVSEAGGVAAETPPTDLPRWVHDIAARWREVVPPLSQLLGISIPSLDLALAASPEQEIFARLDRHAGGTVSLRMTSTSEGVLEARFDAPGIVTVLIVDAAREQVANLSLDRHTWVPFVTLTPQSQPQRIHLQLAAAAIRSDLRLIVFR